jgi:predicted esterase
MELQRKKIDIDFPLDFKLYKNGKKKLAILLHGFAQSAKEIEGELKDSISDEYDILIPNGPFPIPKIRADKIEERYAWYFYNRHTDQYKVNYDFPATILSKLINELGYKDNEKIIIGYSQGGYLSPFLANELQNVTSVYALACTIKWQYLPKELNYPLIQIHGQDDLMVDYKNSKEHFVELAKIAQSSKYISLAGVGHRLEESFKKTLKDFITNQ